MNSPDSYEYRGHRFLIEARDAGGTFTGHFRLLGIASPRADDASEMANHQWTPLDPGWATENEARNNATEAAHAAIDALSGHESHRS